MDSINAHFWSRLEETLDNIRTSYLHKFSKKVRIYKKKFEFTTLAWLKKLHSAIAGRRDQNNKYLFRQSRLLISPEFLMNSDVVCNIPWIPSRNVEKRQMDFCMYTVSEFFEIFPRILTEISDEIPIGKAGIFVY